jgi:hypothetical protein
VRDLLLGSNRLASVAANGLPADNTSSQPTLSADGRYVAFVSAADNLVPNDTNRFSDVFVYDFQSGTTTLVSISTNAASPGNGASYSPAISADVFMLSLYTTSVMPLFSLQSAAGALGQAPAIFWPAMSGITYRVQFKNSLTDPAWQDLPTNPTIIGNQGYLVDPAVPGAQRFYRVLAF